MSPSLTWSKGSMPLTPLLNNSWKTKLIRAPPESSLSERSFVFPSIADRNSAQNSVMVERTTDPGLVSPMAPPSEASSALYLASCWPIRALMSGRVFRMWCIRICRQGRPPYSTHDVELSSEPWGTAVLSFTRVRRMGLKELLLVLQCSCDRLGLVDIPLSSVDDRDVTQPKGDDSTSENVDDIGSLVHEIHLGQDSNRSRSLWVHLPSHLQSVRVGQIGVGGGDSEDDGVWLGDESHEHVTDLLLDIARLVADWDLGETGKVDQGQGEDVRREDTEVDRVRRDTWT